MNELLEITIKCLLAVAVGSAIGSERARHGRAAGMRTHILVCLGAALTSMTSLFVAMHIPLEGDIFRISAQVISGVGFLGAGMIVLKNNNIITGLTTAAGVWATGAIGVAIGYGFYFGAIAVTVLFLGTIILFAKFEKQKKSAEVIYVEIDNMYKTNDILKQLGTALEQPFTFQTVAPKSGNSEHLGLNIVIEKRVPLDLSVLTDIEHIVFAVED